MRWRTRVAVIFCPRPPATRVSDGVRHLEAVAVMQRPRHPRSTLAVVVAPGVHNSVHRCIPPDVGVVVTRSGDVEPSILDQEILGALSDETTNAILRESARLPEGEKQIVLGIVRQFAGRTE